MGYLVAAIAIVGLALVALMIAGARERRRAAARVPAVGGPVGGPTVREPLSGGPVFGDALAGDRPLARPVTERRDRSAPIRRPSAGRGNPRRPRRAAVASGRHT